MGRSSRAVIGIILAALAIAGCTDEAEDAERERRQPASAELVESDLTVGGRRVDRETGLPVRTREDQATSAAAAAQARAAAESNVASARTGSASAQPLRAPRGANGRTLPLRRDGTLADGPDPTRGASGPPVATRTAEDPAFERAMRGTDPVAPGSEQAPAIRAAAAGIVQVLAVRCTGEGAAAISGAGSGWVVAPDLVITNEHVVMDSQRRVRVRLRGTGRAIAALVLEHDAARDLALLRVPGLMRQGARVLRTTTARANQAGATLGFPWGRGYEPRPARIGRAFEQAPAQDAHRGHLASRSWIAARGLAVPGNSGGALVDAAGAVVGTVTAITPPSSDTVVHPVYSSAVDEALDLLAAHRDDAEEPVAC